MPTIPDPTDPSLPLGPVVFEILVSLSAGARHGYAVLLDVEARSEGRMRLRPGTLYRALHRLIADGWVRETDERPDPADDDPRRRYYRLTEAGRSVLAAEVRRLERSLRAAGSRRLLDAEEPT